MKRRVQSCTDEGSIGIVNGESLESLIETDANSVFAGGMMVKGLIKGRKRNDIHLQNQR